ncbi:distal tail protein Dit [Bacillus vallismortis]|uniref:distal tail protein Dit n=1 Tax=Bacillus vallismortis TaxID=72361 RepID=UPI002148AE03|nr:distal tail protein Dit [Bacillus vallismortis]
MTFNGVSKPFLHATVDTKRPMWAPVEWEMVEIPGRPGAYPKQKKIKARPLPVSVVIKGVDDMQKAKEEVAEWLVTDAPCPLIFPDEPDRTYYAMIDGEGQLDEVFKFGKGTINFICPDPYKYGPDTVFDISSINSGSNLVEGGDFAGGHRASGWTSVGTIVPINDLPGFDYALKVTETRKYPAYHFNERSDSLRGKKVNVSMYVKYKNTKYNGTKGNAVYMRARYKEDQSLHYFSSNFKIGTDGIPTQWTRLSFVADLTTLTEEIDQLYFCLNTEDFEPVEMYITGAQVTVGEELKPWSPYGANQIRVNGTAPASPVVKCTLAAAATSYSIELLNDDGSAKQGVYLKFNFIAGDYIEIDFSKRRVTISGIKKSSAILYKSRFFQIPSKKNVRIKASHPSEMRLTEKYK